MKRLHEPDVPQDRLYIVSGCTCYPGEGYSPCSCPRWVEATEEEYKQKDKWDRDNIRQMVAAAVHRQDGNIIQWCDMVLVTPCAHKSICHRVLNKYQEFRDALMPFRQPRFIAALFLNGDFQYWPTDHVEEVIEQIELWEGAGRSNVNAAIFADRDNQKIWCFEQQDNWDALIKPGGELMDCVANHSLSFMTSQASDSKRFISAEALQRHSEDLAFQVAKAGFKPTFLIALWRGGCQPGAVVQEFLEYTQKSVIDHVAVRTVSRDAVTGRPLPEIKVHALGHATSTLTDDSRLLIVDDVWDSGRSVMAIIFHLQVALGEERMPREVKVATVFYKPKRNKVVGKEPDFYVEATDDWLVFPHELVELSDKEVAQFRPYAFAKAQELKEIQQ